MDTSEQQSIPDTCTSDKGEKQTDSEFINDVHLYFQYTHVIEQYTCTCKTILYM